MDEETHLNWAPAIDLPNLIELHTDHLGMKLAKQCPKLARIHLHRKLVPKLIPAEGLRESYYYADMCSPVPSLQHLHPEAKIEYLVLAFWELNDESFDGRNLVLCWRNIELTACNRNSDPNARSSTSRDL